MILLDTHIWVWWVHGDPRLKKSYREFIANNEKTGLRVSIISCWEVAKLIEYKRLNLPISVNEWIDKALNYPGIELTPLTPSIVILNFSHFLTMIWVSGMEFCVTLSPHGTHMLHSQKMEKV